MRVLLKSSPALPSILHSSSSRRPSSASSPVAIAIHQRRNYLDVYRYESWGGSMIPTYTVGQQVNVCISKQDGHVDHIKKLLDRFYATKDSNTHFSPTNLVATFLVYLSEVGGEGETAFPFELKSAYAIAKLRKTGYSKQKFYKEAVELYKEISTLIANVDKTSLRKICSLHSRMKLSKGNLYGVRFTGSWSNLLLKYEFCEPDWSLRAIYSRSWEAVMLCCFNTWMACISGVVDAYSGNNCCHWRFCKKFGSWNSCCSHDNWMLC